MGTDDIKGKKKQMMMTMVMAITPVIPSERTYSFKTSMSEDNSLKRWIIISQLKMENRASTVKSANIVKMTAFSLLRLIIIDLFANFSPHIVV